MVLQLWVAKICSNSSSLDASMEVDGRRKKKDGGERERVLTGGGGVSRVSREENEGHAKFPKYPHSLNLLSQVQSYSIPLIYFITRTKPKSII